MGKSNIPEEIIREIEDLIELDKESTQTRETNLIFDGRQFSIKIPKDIAEMISLKPDEKIVFLVKKFPIEERKESELTIVIKKENEKNSRLE